MPCLLRQPDLPHRVLGRLASWSALCLTMCLWLWAPARGWCGPQQLGDLDADGTLTVLDLVALVNHFTGLQALPPNLVVYADFNQDGVVNEQDADLLSQVILGLAPPPQLPLDRLLSTSPAQGEVDVSVTRETVFKFTMPLSPATVLTTNDLYATFGGRKFLTRVELSSDGRKVSLFYLEPLPGGALIRVTFNGGPLLDFLGRPVDLVGNGTAGGQFTLDFETLNNNPLAGTVVAGRVFASDLAASQGATNQFVNQPLGGVTITVDGQEETLRAVTDQFGNFRLDPAPAGDFFVHIDGRTATNAVPGGGYPRGAYYPYVGKEWQGVVGQEVNIGNIYLPLITAGTLQPVSTTTNTTVTFPDSVVQADPRLQGVSITVPANSLFSNDGTRGGMVGIAPVPPDRLPSPLPQGLQFGLVITVQSDGGQNFDRPVPACFPNVPDPNTGQALPPGAKSALWSFNHRTGRWEVQGPMTVSADGKFVCTDPGVGIPMPGWHGVQQGSTVSGGGLVSGGGATTGKEPPDPCHPPKHLTDPVYLFSGEFQESATDLMIKGRGMDFAWTRKYRSKIGANSRQGNGWDCMDNCYMEVQATNLVLHDGNSRADTYSLQPDGTYAAPGYFRQLSKSADGTYTLTFADRGQWSFYAADGSSQGGRRSAITDRNGNQMRFTYDAQGRLSQIIDTLGRTNQLAYNAQGYIASLADFTGRSVRYTYYDGNEPGGSAGDLKSVTSPAVTGTPTGNDFPNGKTTTYTYSTGFADDRLNHNLLTITDGRRNDTNDTTYGQGPYLVNIYASTTDPSDPLFDHVVRQIWGGDSLDMVYVPLLPSNANGNAILKTIVRDRVGNVKEYFYDAQNRMLRSREYTGRADPTRPTTELGNRPVKQLRPGDPNYFETVFEWTDDSQARRVIYPNGNLTEYVYEADQNPKASARTRGNLRTLRHLPGTHVPAGDQAVIEETFEYDTDFGSCCGFNFITRDTDGRGNATVFQYDDRGNRIHATYAIAGVAEDWEYNQFGQITAHIAPPDATGYRRRDEQSYYAAGPPMGYLQQVTVDAKGLQIATTFEYDAVGNVVHSTDPNGHDARRFVNQLNQVVRVISPEVTPGSGIHYQHDYYYDANNNVFRMDVVNLDEKGVPQSPTNLTTRIEYEPLNHPVRLAQDIDATHSAITEFAYDANRNRVLVREPEAANGHQPANVVQTLYDERDLPFQIVAAPGDPAQSTSETDYDRNGNPILTLDGIESGARTTELEYDGYDRLVTTTDAMGNRRHYQFDADHNPVHAWVEGELVDLPGSTNNVRLAEATRVFDELNRLIEIDAAHFDPATQQPIGSGTATMRREYAPNSELTRLVNDNGHEVRFAYDTADRLATETDARGDTVARSYDLAGNIVALMEVQKSDLGAPDVARTNTYSFDSLNRLTRRVDNAGNVNDFAYDSRNNLVVAFDAARPNANTPGNRAHRVYDGLDRILQMTTELTSDGTGSGAPAGQIVLRREWDDDGRLTAMYDGNGNPTRYHYDALDRLTQTTLASGSVKTVQYDAHSDARAITDANGTVIHQRFDSLDRIIRKDVTPGPGVASDTTFENWSYDGQSRVVQAVNDATQVGLTYDSFGYLTRDTIDGRAVHRAYDGTGNALLTSYPGGRKIAATFDLLEQLKSLTDVTAASPVAIASFDYAGPRRIARRSNGNRTRLDLSYDALNRLIRGTHSTVGGAAIDDRDYGWDANSHQILNRDRLAGGVSQAYTYDSAYRLSSVTLTGGLNQQRAYQWDAAGNRVVVTGAGDAGTYTQASAPSMDASLNQYTTTPFDQRAYDPNGNLLQITASGQVRTLEYDYLNRLVRYQANGLTNLYVYDALGRRVARTTGNGTTATTLYCYLGRRMLEEQDASGATLATFVFGDSRNDVVSLQRAGANYWLHADDLSSVRHVTDANGQVVESYWYDEFGNPALFNALGQSIASSSVGNPYLYTGYQFDSESGLYYAQRRFYDPRAGRFISRDPAGAWGDPMSLGNSFAYAGNNPTTFFDPTGLSGKSPRPREFVGPATQAAAAQALGQGNQLLNQAAQATAQAGELTDASAKALAEAERINDTVGNEMLNWTEGYLNGTIAEEGPGGQLIYEQAANEGEAAEIVNGMFGRAFNPIGPGQGTKAIMSPQAAIAAKGHYYNNAVEDIQALEQKSAQLAEKALEKESQAASLAAKGSKLKVAGKALAVAGVALQTGLAVYDDIKNCADGVTTVNDAIGTAGANVALLGAPPLAAADLVTGGAISGGIHNAAITPVTAARVAFGRVNNRDADAIKATYTRFAVGRWAWDAGEWWADTLMGD